MKYLIITLGIIWLVTVSTFYFLWSDKSADEGNIAVTINGHNLALNSVSAGAEPVGYHSEEYADLLDSAITRELLIQEAQRQDIDKEESFRLSLKSYYEESLIKILMDRQYAQPISEITEAEVDSYLSFYGKIVTFSRLSVKDRVVEVAATPGTINEVLFDDLAEPMKILLSSLNPGEHAIRYDTGNDQYAIKLEKIADSGAPPTQLPDINRVKTLLEEYRHQQQIDNWLNELRQNASITIHNG